MIWFILGLIIGFIVGFVCAALGQCKLEEKYVEKRIAKIFGDYYKITPIKITEED